MNTVVKMVFGSHLYGVDTPDSDRDYRGVYIPSADEILLGDYRETVSECTSGMHQKNTKDDIDVNLFSLKRFIRLAVKGDIGAIDMIHAPDEMIVENSDVWRFIRNNRSKFYSANMRGMQGYLTKTTRYMESYSNARSWKDASHALRVGYQLLEILNTGDLKFPLINRDRVLACKLGKLSHDEVLQELQGLIVDIKEAREKAILNWLREEVDNDFWKTFIKNVHYDAVKKAYTGD